MAIMYGDTTGILEARAKAQHLRGVDGEDNYVYGDAYLIENSKGGNDVLTGGSNSYFNVLYGDAFQMSYSQGGNDTLTGGASSSYNLLHGDASQMYESQGGNDVINGAAESILNLLYGDAANMYGSKGGNDILTVGSNSYFNYVYGDAFQMSDSQGGNDILIAGSNLMSGAFVTINFLVGDALYNFFGKTICGNDRLISGAGNDYIWGDIGFSDYAGSPIDLTRVTTGQDVFVFSTNNGYDTIHDFRQGEDKIELQDIGVDSFDALMAASHLSQDSMNSVITFGDNTITVIGVTELTAADFLFT